jgi:hypothetical protein
LLGVWEGIPYIVGGSRLESAPVRCSPCYTVSLSLGWRWGGDGEFYLSPKFGILNDVWKPFPFAHD